MLTKHRTTSPGIALVGLLAVLLLCFVYKASGSSDILRFGDFFALWSYCRIALDHGANILYDPAALHVQQMALGLGADGFAPYPYPPPFLLLELLGRLPMNGAYLVFMGGSLAAYCYASFAGTRLALTTAGALVLAPTTFFTITLGQTGFLAAALLIGGMRAASTRPLLGGVLLGLLAYKPQLGLLVPVALLAAGLWRPALAAGLTVLGLVLFTSLAFGWSLWPAWLAALPGYHAQFLAQQQLSWLLLSVADTARYLGVPTTAAYVIQAASGLFAATLVWRTCRRGISPSSIAVLTAATFFATPHALIYDMPMITASALLYANDLKQSGRDGRSDSNDLFATLLLFAAVCVPAIPILAPKHLPFGLLPPLATLGISAIARRAAA